MITSASTSSPSRTNAGSTRGTAPIANRRLLGISRSLQQSPGTPCKPRGVETSSLTRDAYHRQTGLTASTRDLISYWKVMRPLIGRSTTCTRSWSSRSRSRIRLRCVGALKSFTKSCTPRGYPTRSSSAIHIGWTRSYPDRRRSRSSLHVDRSRLQRLAWLPKILRSSSGADQRDRSSSIPEEVLYGFRQSRFGEATRGELHEVLEPRRGTRPQPQVCQRIHETAVRALSTAPETSDRSQADSLRAKDRERPGNRDSDSSLAPPPLEPISLPP